MLSLVQTVLHMNDYTNFEVEDFMLNDYFIDWVKSPGNDSNQFWKDWITHHPEQKSKIEIAIAAITTFNYQTPNLPETFYASLKQDIDTTIANKVSVKKFTTTRILNTWMKVAAVSIGIAVVSSLFYFYFQSTATIKIVTAFKETKTFELPDHSLVTLNASSSLEYPKEWNDNEREVTLKGEGFFRITHIEKQNGAAKFIVHANEVSIEVLGTEFNIKNRENITGVMLQTGKVQLRINGQGTAQVMKPTDYFSFNSTTKEISTKTVNPSYYTAWLNHKYSFSKATLTEVCNELQDFYGLRFEIKNRELANQEITGTLLLEDEPSLLQTLSSFLNANITLQGQQVTISSK